MSNNLSNEMSNACITDIIVLFITLAAVSAACALYYRIGH